MRAAAARQPPDVEYLWPENQLAWECWMSVQTQWRIGMSGATGLDYAGVRAALSIRGVRGAELRDVFECIQAAETATLVALANRTKEGD